ncbi:hypothetical protein CFC35_05610 [Streptomyces sp. FBKL.4005]|uniref:hypothetical protein n=1 Tax=Streptomyces sp. FBKL.4005 TaxID=2015515 RepID=UPI000B95FED9|nr:hypothetical protein [Streptomyces sp. FBKL.4005]OYP14042.1 hypothetical protein CFC35_05610 [Streptomyces sp. FBKL.4005]
MNQPDPQPAPGQVWLSRYTTGMYVAVTAVEGDRVRLIPVTVTPQGAVIPAVGRGRWASAGQLRRAYRLTDHVLESAR